MSHFIPALRIFLSLTILTGLLYPLAMTGIAQALFSKGANGSLIVKDGKVIGSELIGQKFEGDRYFWSRPSAIDYNPQPSGGTNLAPTALKLKEQAEKQKVRLQGTVNVPSSGNLPLEMIFASGSGLDPEISPEGASLQVERILKARGIAESDLRTLIAAHTKHRQLGFLGEKRVNVLELNLALDRAGGSTP